MIHTTLRFSMSQSILAAICMAAATITTAADVSMGDKSFLEDAMQSGKFEIEGSQLALQKSKNENVLAFAKQMVQDHTKSGEEVKALAAKKGVEVIDEPSIVQKGKLKLLATHDGAKFDESYADVVGVSAHEATIKLFEKAAKDAEDPEIKQLASKTLPKLKHHLEMAKALQSKTATK